MLVHTPSNSLILKLRDPSTVTNVIPRARVISYKGVDLTQVHFGLDEVRVLRNLGINAPSPVKYNYKWEGKFNPFKHQITTTEFFTLNPKSICLNDMGCVDSETEYLSPTGWKKISEYTSGKVAQYYPDSRQAEFVDPTQFVKLPCDRMFRVKTSRGIDQLLSPEHRVLIHSRTKPGKYEVVQAERLYDRQEAYRNKQPWAKSADRIGWSQAAIPTAFSMKNIVDRFPDSNSRLRLQVAIIADGHFPNATSRCVVRLKKARKVDRLRQLLAQSSVPYSERVITEADARSDIGFHVFTFTAPVKEKEFGERWWACSPAQLRIVADEAPHWDGHTPTAGKRGVRFSSTSKASADFVQYAFSATGNTATMSVDSRPYAGGKMCYEVRVRKGVTQLGVHGVTDTKEPTQPITAESSTDGFKYCFMVPSTFLLFRRNGCVFASGNTGKTLSALWAADYLMQKGIRKKCIIVSPLSTMDSVWANEIRMHFMFTRTCAVIHGSKERRLKMLAMDVDFYIINHDGLKVIANELRKRTDIDLWILDEAAVYRNSQTARFKAMQSMVRPTDWMWMMTGTPCPTAPTDAWGLAKLMGSPKAPKYFTTFKHATMEQVTQYKWIPKHGAFEQAYAILQPGIRFKKSDCIDLPPITFQHRVCDLTSAQSKAYKDMHHELVTQIGGAQITAANAAVKLSKLLQICCGVAYDGHGGHANVDSTSRLELVEEICEEAANKIVIFVPFTAALHQVAAHLRKRWSVEVVNGSTSPTERKRIFDSFQYADDPRILVAHPKTTAHGLTLTQADTTIWYAPIFSLEIFEQANNRMNRPGQRNPMTVAMIESTGMESAVYAALKGKGRMQDSVLDLYKKEVGLT